jgi:hypothetical protein
LRIHPFGFFAVSILLGLPIVASKDTLSKGIPVAENQGNREMPDGTSRWLGGEN